MSFRTRRLLSRKEQEVKEVVIEEVAEEVVVEPILIKEEVVEIEEIEIIEEVLEKGEVVVEEKVEQPKEEVVEENKYAVEEFVVINDKKVSKFDLEPVICLNTGVIYDNNKVAMQETGVNSGAIKRNCRGFTKSAGKDENGKKLVWKFAKDVE